MTARGVRRYDGGLRLAAAWAGGNDESRMPTRIEVKHWIPASAGMTGLNVHANDGAGDTRA